MLMANCLSVPSRCLREIRAYILRSVGTRCAPVLRRTVRDDHSLRQCASLRNYLETKALMFTGRNIAFDKTAFLMKRKKVHHGESLQNVGNIAEALYTYMHIKQRDAYLFIVYSDNLF